MGCWCLAHFNHFTIIICALHSANKRNQKNVICHLTKQTNNHCKSSLMPCVLRHDLTPCLCQSTLKYMLQLIMASTLQYVNFFVYITYKYFLYLWINETSHNNCNLCFIANLFKCYSSIWCSRETTTNVQQGEVISYLSLKFCKWWQH